MRNQQVYLDGKLIDVSEINPAKHIFIGNFRSPNPPESMGGDIYCPCGQILRVVGMELEHWQRGHWDIPIYKTY